MESKVSFYEDSRREELIDAAKEGPDAEEGGGDDEGCGDGGGFNLWKG